MIRELNSKEIKIIEDYLGLMSFYYPYYSLGKKENTYSDFGYLISNEYYVNLQLLNNSLFLGICNLGKGERLYELNSLFLSIIKKYQKINVWCFKNNKNMIQLIEKSIPFLEKKNIKVSKEGESIIYYRFEEV